MTTDQEEVSLELLKQQLEAERLRLKLLDGELEAERTKTRGMQMLFDCMQEEHCENRRLKRLVKKHRHTMQKLRRRLQAHPDGAGQIDWEDLSDLSEIEESTERETQRLCSTQDGEQECPSQRIEAWVAFTVFHDTLCCKYMLFGIDMLCGIDILLLYLLIFIDILF